MDLKRMNIGWPNNSTSEYILITKTQSKALCTNIKLQCTCAIYFGAIHPYPYALALCLIAWERLMFNNMNSA